MPISNPKLVPCLWFDDQAEQAAAFYVQTFTGSRVISTSRYPDSSDNPGGLPPGSVLTVELEVAGQRLTALNGGPAFVPNPSLSFFVLVDTPEDAYLLFKALGVFGEALMPLDTYPWSERYGWVKDRFGISWQVTAGLRAASGATMVPCLMFSGAQQGRAEEAMRFYAGVFPGGRIDRVERYDIGEGPPGAVKHGRLTLAGQELVAMDSHDHRGFTFTEALSLQVMCEDQAELDRYWDALAEGGEHGPCGWLKDRFGFSWQIVPAAIARWMAGTDTAARDRTFAAILKMKKLDIAALQRAYDGINPKGA